MYYKKRNIYSLVNIICAIKINIVKIQTNILIYNILYDLSTLKYMI